MATQGETVAITMEEFDTCLGGYQAFAPFAVASNASAEAEAMSANYQIIEASTDSEVGSDDENDKDGAP